MDLKYEVYRNIALSGGSCCIAGIDRRIMSNRSFVNIVKVKESDKGLREYLTWIGGSIMSSWSSFNDLVIAKDEYDEYRGTIVYRKCF